MRGLLVSRRGVAMENATASEIEAFRRLPS